MLRVATMLMVNVNASQDGQVPLVLSNVLLIHGDTTVLKNANVQIIYLVIRPLESVFVLQAIQAAHAQNHVPKAIMAKVACPSVRIVLVHPVTPTMEVVSVQVAGLEKTVNKHVMRGSMGLTVS
jgi:hypothetical protein